MTDMIREELLVQRGLELDVSQSDPEVRNALVNAVENEVAADALTAQPTQAQLEPITTHTRRSTRLKAS